MQIVVKKSFVMDLIKGKVLSFRGKGEGSRGGKIIGHTKSGKPIYANSHDRENKNWSHHDHLDAQRAHLDIVDRLDARVDDIDALDVSMEHEDAAAHHFRQAKKAKRSKAKAKKKKD